MIYFQNYNIYKRIVSEVLRMRNLNKAESYRTWADLRDMLFDLVSALSDYMFFTFLERVMQTFDAN